MAYIDLVGIILLQELRDIVERAEYRLNQRTLRDASNTFTLPERLFRNLFRFNKETTTIIVNMIQPNLEQRTRLTGIPTHLKVLACLHFYATGSYQLTCGQSYNFALSQPSMSRCIEEVTNVIYYNLLQGWIKFPNSEAKRNDMKEGFLLKYNFPRCLGAIDCTHIAIISPPGNYPALPYYCRKGYYSINCQIIADSEYNILNMNARFPGSTHDSAIWQASNIRRLMENLHVRGNNSVLIGDAGYPLLPYLLTPFDNPIENTPDSNYNFHFIRARNIIEKVNGILKSRFRCLLKHRVLNYDPIKAGKIIYSCGVLHNISQFYRDEIQDEELIIDDHLDDQENILILLGDNWNWRGEQIRNEIVNQYFR